MVEPNIYPGEISPPPAAAPKKQSAEAELFEKVSKNVNSIATNLRIIEERYSTLRSKSQVSEQSIIELEKDVRQDIKILSSDILELKRQVKDINDKLRLISNEMKSLVSRNDLRVMERYLDFWQPMNFVTRNELSKIIETARANESNKT